MEEPVKTRDEEPARTRGEIEDRYPIYAKYRSLTPPSLAYQEASKSPVYRLSELMFGSLLASIVAVDIEK